MAHARGEAPAGGSNAAKLELPLVADIQCTQNAGRGVAIPSGGGIAAIWRVEHGRAIDVPRTSVRDYHMTDGEPMPSVKAAGSNDSGRCP